MTHYVIDYECVKSEVSTAVNTAMFLWTLTPCRLVGIYQHFGETCCLHLQGFWIMKWYRLEGKYQYFGGPYILDLHG